MLHADGDERILFIDKYDLMNKWLRRTLNVDKDRTDGSRTFLCLKEQRTSFLSVDATKI